MEKKRVGRQEAVNNFPGRLYYLHIKSKDGRVGKDREKTGRKKQKKMTIEIWSDVMCPFCYIGKRKLEAALAGFPQRGQVRVEWRSFQLDPQMPTDPEKDVISYLAEVKGQSRAWSEAAHRQVTEMARQEGLEYRFEQAVVANSFDAHRLLQLAKTSGRGDAAEEALFRGYFTDGVNIADHEALARLGASIGLEAEAVRVMLASGAYADAVQRDIGEARQLGIRGVPFFLMNRRYAVSGAQPVEVFRRALDKAFAEWAGQPSIVEMDGADGTVCDMDGNCD